MTRAGEPLASEPGRRPIMHHPTEPMGSVLQPVSFCDKNKGASAAINNGGGIFGQGTSMSVSNHSTPSQLRKVETRVGGDLSSFADAKQIPAKTVLNRLGIKVHSGGKFICPSHPHPDKNPSADFMREGQWGNVWTCRSCGASGSSIDLVMKSKNLDAVAAVGWILDKSEPIKTTAPKAGEVEPDKAPRPFDSLKKAVSSIRVTGHRVSKMFAYDDHHYVVRLEEVAPAEGEKRKKSIRPIHQADDGQWYVNKGDKPWPLYGTHNLDVAHNEAIIVVVEGEKAADAINGAKCRFYAVTSQGGHQSGKSADWSTLPAGLPILVWPDNDKGGQIYADAVIEGIAGVNLWPDQGIRIVSTDGWPDKWDAADELHGLSQIEVQDRIESVIVNRSKVVMSPEQRRVESAVSRLNEMGFRAASDIEPEPVEYLIPGVMARGELTLVTGDAGSGKTKVCTARAAHLTTGKSIDGYPIRNGPHKVAILSFEECPKRTISPVCRWSGMNMDNAMIWEPPDDGPGISTVIELCQMLESLAAAGYAYILIDSLTALYGRLGYEVNDSKAPYIVHTAINRVARSRNLCIEMIHHNSKGGGQVHTNHQKSAGSYAIFSSVRSVLQVEHDPTTGTRFIGVSPNKNNLGLQQACLAFRTQRVAEHLNDGQGYIVGVLAGWNDSETIDDISARVMKAKNDDHRSKVKPVAVEVSEAIETFVGKADGVCLVKDLDTHLLKAGYSSNAVRDGKKQFEKFRIAGSPQWFITTIKVEVARELAHLRTTDVIEVLDADPPEST